MSRENYDNDYNDNENEDKENSDEKEDEKLENARYMRMARSKSKKQSKLFTMRKKVMYLKNQDKILFMEIII